MLNMNTKNGQLPALRSPLGSTISNTLWGNLGDMDRLFDRLFHGFDQTLATASWKAPLAVWEDSERYYVEVELPGVSQENVDVTVHERQLVIRYQRPAPEGRQFLFNERPFGQFERRVALPDTVNVDSIEAELRDGVLCVKLAKSIEAQPRKIAVQVRQ